MDKLTFDSVYEKSSWIIHRLVSAYESLYIPASEHLTEFFGDYGETFSKQGVTPLQLKERTELALAALNMTLQEYISSGIYNTTGEIEDALKKASPLFEKEEARYEFEYQLLDRLRTDCNYFLGNGNRLEKNLWAGTVEKQIAKMRELYNHLPEKPEWLSLQDIDNYENQMLSNPETKEQEQPKEPSPDNFLTGDTIATPRGFSFHVTSLNKEQMKAAGFSYHHSSDDGKYEIMTNGITAYAVSSQPAEKTKPHKSKEMER